MKRTNYVVGTIVMVLFVLGMFLSSCQEQGGEGAPISDIPTLEIVGGETVDWGDVGQGTLKKEIKVVNVGGGTLEISKVKPSCGCTTAPLDKEKLAYGDTATINLEMDVKTRSGMTTKTLTISSNDSSRPDVVVELKANVLQAIAHIPRAFIVTGIEAGEEGEGSVTLTNTSEKPIAIEPPVLVDTPLMVVRFNMNEKQVLDPGDSLKITAFATPINSGPASANVLFKTDSEISPELRIQLTVNTSSNISTEVVSSGS